MEEEQIRQIIREELSGLLGTDRYMFQRHLQVFDGRNIHFGTSTGTKIGTESTQKLAFYGATPIIQQTTTSQTAAAFSANTSGISDDSATWDGYTIGDIVAILKAYGLLS